MFKRDGKWWVSITFRGKRIRRSTETQNLGLAKSIEAKLRTDLIEGKYFDKYEGERKTFGEMMDRFMKEHSPKVAQNTQDSYRASLKHLLKFFGGLVLSEITVKKVHEYKQARKAAGGGAPSINRSLAMLSKAFSLAFREWEWVKDNPVSKVSREKESSGRDRWLTGEEERRLLEHSPQWLREIITFDLHTGLREDELLSLTWDRVDLFRRVIIIQESKNGAPRTIPLTKTALGILTDKASIINLKGIVFPSSATKKINAQNLNRAFNAATRKAEVQDFHFHDLRHTFATRLAQRGVDLYRISKLLGHYDISMTQRYAHHCPESLRGGIEVLEDSGHDLVTVRKTASVSNA